MAGWYRHITGNRPVLAGLSVIVHLAQKPEDKVYHSSDEGPTPIIAPEGLAGPGGQT